MHAHLSRRPPPALLFLLFALFSLTTSQAAEAALARKSPEVIQAVRRGVEYLAAHGDSDSRPGATALAGLAMLTGGEKSDHPTIGKCAASIQKALGDRDKPSTDRFDVYSTGLSIIFLVDLDAEKYRTEIECLLAHLIKTQKEHGGWGYPNLSTGDTSMTQYGVLGLWKARRKGFDVPLKSIERAARWLLATQDPSGGFGYQGKIGEDNQLVAQSEVRPSLTAAGLGSLYICCDMLDINIKIEQPKKELPPAIREVKPKDGEKSGKSKTKTSIKAPAVREAQTLGNQWFAQNFKVNAGQYNNYYFYAFERYMTFRGRCEKKEEENPQWYSDIAAFLLEKQADDGSWRAECGTVPDTAFALLFLLRYTDMSFPDEDKYGYGLMVGASTLPKDFRNLGVTPDGKIVPKTSLSDVEGMLKDLLNRELPDFDDLGPRIEGLSDEEIKKLIEKYGEAFRRMISGRSVEARLEAVRAYGKTRNLDHFEVLLYAMTDPAPVVVHEANAALMRIRRSPGAVVLPDDFTESDRREAIRKWKAWYLSVRPDAKFEWSETPRAD